MQYSIVVKHVSKRYGNHIAIDDISFQVKKGEIFAFLGPNGAGKSTTISILSTLLSWDTGSIEMEGYTLGVQNHAIRKELGIVFQGSMLDESLSV
ncbi:MAG: ATP-binding cassette domain-containing protein, partial [Longicatena sp.]